MKKANPDLSHRFKPGQIANPAGRTPIPEDIKKSRKNRRLALERAVNHQLFISVEKLRRRMKNNRLPAFDRLVIACILRAESEGDLQKLVWFSKVLAKTPLPSKTAIKNALLSNDLPPVPNYKPPELMNNPYLDLDDLEELGVPKEFRKDFEKAEQILQDKEKTLSDLQPPSPTDTKA